MSQMKSVIIIGSARSGIGAAKLAHAKGQKVTLYDQKSQSQMNDDLKKTVDELIALGIEFKSGDIIDLKNYDEIIVSPGVPFDLPFLEDAKKNGKKVIGEFEYAWGYCEAEVVAITGTNGKTTTTALVGEIIKAHNENTFIVGNIGRAFSEDVQIIPPNGIVVAEVSSFQLESSDTFHPRVAALLNISPDHLNRHKTMENYCLAKYAITKQQTENDFFILNGNDPYYEEAKKYSKAKIVTFDGQKSVEYGTFAKDGKLFENMSKHCNEICEIKDLKVLGKHNIENVLAAIAIAKGIGVPNDVITNIVKNFKGVEHRIEYVATKNDVDYYNDSKATNVGAAIPGLCAMQRLVHLIAGGIDKQTSFAEWIELFNKRVKKLYLIGETKFQIAEECKKVGFTNFEIYETFEEAVLAAAAKAQPKECVLLSPACASWDMFESYEQRGELFKQIVNNIEG
ncbi:MAG: UDP-N-acetylmuramoyl-L-alanine--D-glutamate ligase [Cellulosilyticaceae bacterium]